MDKDFFVKESEAHSGMLYRVVYTMQESDMPFTAADEINSGCQKPILSK